MIIPIELEVIISNDYVDDFNLAHVDLTEDMITWIKRMEKLVKDNDIAYLADYECTPEYSYKDFSNEIKPFDGNVECNMIVIQDRQFYWKGIIKHTDVHFETETFSIEDLDKLIEFYNKPDKDMPKYINDEDFSKREIASRRMKGEE